MQFLRVYSIRLQWGGSRVGREPSIPVVSRISGMLRVLIASSAVGPSWAVVQLEPGEVGEGTRLPWRRGGFFGSAVQRFSCRCLRLGVGLEKWS
jgi:hypothetical protein